MWQCRVKGPSCTQFLKISFDMLIFYVCMSGSLASFPHQRPTLHFSENVCSCRLLPCDWRYNQTLCVYANLWQSVGIMLSQEDMKQQWEIYMSTQASSKLGISWYVMVHAWFDAWYRISTTTHAWNVLNQCNLQWFVVLSFLLGLNVSMTPRFLV